MKAQKLLAMLVIMCCPAFVQLHADVYNIKDFGAKGDGKHIDSHAINAAISRASAAGGGTVYVPAGNYACYSIRLASHTNIYLEQGATIIAEFPTDSAGYDAPEPNPHSRHQDFGHSHWKNSLIWGIGLEDITISGPGTIFGKGLTREGGRRQGTGNKADAIVLKASYALGYFKDTENVTISDCFVSGYDRNTMLDATWELDEPQAPDHGGRTGRIKIGTESSGGFKNISITNCVFEHCRGLALETVDGGQLEDVVISNITMRHIVNSAIFLRLGSRMRSPEGTPPGVMRRIRISNVVASDVDSRYSSIISGVPGNVIEDVAFSNITIRYRGGYKAEDVADTIPEAEKDYPEPWMFGTVPARGFYVRHARNISFDNINFSFSAPDTRPLFVTDDSEGLYFSGIREEGKPVAVQPLKQ